MPTEEFWRDRFNRLGLNSVARGLSGGDDELDEHKNIFLGHLRPILQTLEGPVLDFGCGTGRWVPDLPRPYLGLDLLQEHIEVCRTRYDENDSIRFDLASQLHTLPDNSFKGIFSFTVLQHIVEEDVRSNTIFHLARVLSEDGVFLAVEWSPNQRQLEWCTSVGKRDFEPWFSVAMLGEIEAYGPRHTVWICRKKRKSRTWRLFKRFSEAG